MEQLQSLAVRKQQLVTEIEVLEAKRVQDMTGKQADDAQSLQTLKQLAQQCQQQNAANGAIIQAGYQFTIRALSALRGQDTNGQQTYDTNGQTSARLDSISLAKA
jgi:flagellar biosynthesis/type III secretory pathway chaperone